MKGRLDEAAEQLNYDRLFEVREAQRAKETLSDVQTLKKDIAIARRRMRAHGRWLLQPSAPSMQLWDLVVLLALVFTVTVTPYEIGFLPSAMGATQRLDASEQREEVRRTRVNSARSRAACTEGAVGGVPPSAVIAFVAGSRTVH